MATGTTQGQAFAGKAGAMKIVIDANIIIYSAFSNQGELRKWLGKHRPVISAITQLEVLGYHKITAKEIAFAKRYFSFCQVVPIDQTVLQRAIDFRQQKNMGIGDALVAATTMIKDCLSLPPISKIFSTLKDCSCSTRFTAKPIRKTKNA